MLIYKFGGASVKDFEGIMNLGDIVSKVSGKLIVIVSALGKTTNAFEKLVDEFLNGKNYAKSLEAIETFHSAIAEKCNKGVESGFTLEAEFQELRNLLGSLDRDNNDFVYDQVVSAGELWSTKIVHQWLTSIGSDSKWIDIRKLLITDKRYKDANVDWTESKRRFDHDFNVNEAQVFVAQGFIGGTPDGYTSTLGREGSDFTAGILANIMDAQSLTVWKDVPGVLNADPKWMTETEKLDNISYKEAVEMSFSGAKVIHPKTIKPLHNKGIPLFVKSFLDSESPGTVISVDESLAQNTPLFIKKEEQVLLSFIPKDFSFVLGDNLSLLFQAFYENGIKTNLVQASAVSIAVCIDEEPARVKALISKLEKDYKILVNSKVEILSLRYYDDEAIKKITANREILLEQRTRKSIRYVVKQIDQTEV